MKIFGKLSKQHVFLVCFLFTAFAAFGQSYLGWVTQAANLRSGPGTNYDILKTLPARTQIFVFSATAENDFYKVKDIASDVDGYVSRSLVELGEVLEEYNDVFQREGRTSGTNPQLRIYNNTSRTLTLTLNNEKYVFSPQETKAITVIAGRYRYMASSPGVIPYFGNSDLVNNTSYSWTFYIE